MITTHHRAGHNLTPYQAFAFLWHLNRGDTAAAQLVAMLPSECFAEFDRMLETAFALGVAMKETN